VYTSEAPASWRGDLARRLGGRGGYPQWGSGGDPPPLGGSGGTPVGGLGGRSPPCRGVWGGETPQEKNQDYTPKGSLFIYTRRVATVR
jgi:hypothetical protein